MYAGEAGKGAQDKGCRRMCGLNIVNSTGCRLFVRHSNAPLYLTDWLARETLQGGSSKILLRSGILRAETTVEPTYGDVLQQ